MFPKQNWKNSSDFIKWLESQILTYRLEHLTRFYADPSLQLGSPGQSINILGMLIQTIGFGPLALPVPAGSFTNSDNEIFTPGFNALNNTNKDIIHVGDVRCANPFEAHPDGVECENTQGGASLNWRTADLALTLAAGGIAATNLATGLSGRKIEVVINYINVTAPVDDVTPIALLFTFSAAAGAVNGQDSPVALFYNSDVTNVVLYGSNHITFPYASKRMITANDNTNIRIAVSGGNGAEEITVGYSYRYTR